LKTKLFQTLFLSLFLWSIQLSAQDLHFSQFYNSPLNLNPALAGVFTGDIRFIGNYRNQWESVPVPYLTFSGAYDTKISSKLTPNGYFAVGGIFNYDKQGSGELSLTQLSISGSYTHQLSDYAFLTAGVQIGSLTRAFKMEGLTFENQFNGDVFDANLDPRENFENTSKSFLDFGTGLNFHIQNDNGFSINIGSGIFHLSRPAQNFYNQTSSELPFRTTAYLIGIAMLNPKMDLQFRLVSQFQGPYHEYLGGSALVYKLNDTRGKELSVSFGTNYRYADESDAIIPTLGIKYVMWYAELSYDINVSQFTEATNGAGGPEISVIYTITKVKPPNTFKACPIF
jgi:type IX secretion system PorP/SprF family membrane protein